MPGLARRRRVVGVVALEVVPPQAGVDRQPVQRPLVLHVDAGIRQLVGLGRPRHEYRHYRNAEYGAGIRPVGPAAVRLVLPLERGPETELQVVAAGDVRHRRAHGLVERREPHGVAFEQPTHVARHRQWNRTDQLQQAGQIGPRAEVRAVALGVECVVERVQDAVRGQPRVACLEQDPVRLRPDPCRLVGVERGRALAARFRGDVERIELRPGERRGLLDVAVGVVDLDLVARGRLPREAPRVLVVVRNFLRRVVGIRHIGKCAGVLAVEQARREEGGPAIGVARVEPQVVAHDRGRRAAGRPATSGRPGRRRPSRRLSRGRSGPGRRCSTASSDARSSRRTPR